MAERLAGIGLDIVEVARLERLVAENPGLEPELFTAGELEYCAHRRRRSEHLAARFAAKEAVLKAFGTGLRQRLRWSDIEVVSEASGRPRIELHGEVALWARRRSITEVLISMSHSGGYAVAQAVATAGPDAP